MRKSIALIILQASMLCAVGQSKMQDPVLNHKDVMGLWLGHYEQSGIKKSLTIEFKETNGELECYVDIPDRSIKSAKFKIRYCPAHDLHLTRTSTEKTLLMDNTYLVFVGKPVGDSITGHYGFGNSCTAGPAPAFSLRRSTSF